MKQLTLPLLLLQHFFAFSQPTVLTQGDIAITGFNFKNPDEFSFVSFVKLNPGTTIYFTDSGWKNDNTFRRGEGLITYTVPNTGTKAFQVINYPNDSGFKTEGIDGFFGFAVGGDQLFAFQGSFISPKFLFGINANDGTWQNDALDNNTSKLPDELKNTPYSLAFSKDNGSYNCQIESGQDKSILINSIGSLSNWFTSNERFTFSPSCFDSSLPLSIISLNIDYTSTHFLITLETLSNFSAQIHLEGSDNGKVFFTIDSTTVTSGHQRLVFTSNIKYEYIRIKTQENNSINYSDIKAVQNFSIEPVEFMVYSSYGQLLLHEKSKLFNEDKIMHLLNTHSFVLIKKIFEDGSIKFEKIIDSN